MTLIVNLFGGPGVGKSTTAAKVFGVLKDREVKVEYVPEWVKGWAWQEREIKPYDNFYIAAKQFKSISDLVGKVDVIITDSPMYLGGYYGGIDLSNTISYFRRMLNANELNINLQRVKPYHKHGRYQTEAEAKQIDEELLKYMRNIVGLSEMPQCSSVEEILVLLDKALES